MTPLPAAILTTPLAHRGYHDAAHGRPENSRAAFVAAIDGGYGIELDVQPSADETAMVFHDYTLDRLTSQTGALVLHDAATLGKIRLNGGDEGIPSLTEVLELVRGRVPLLIEIKDQDGALGPRVGPLERAVATCLARYAGPVAVMSFNPHSVAMMADLADAIPRGLTTCGFAAEDWPLSEQTRARLRTIPDYAAVGASFISHDACDLDNPAVARVRAQGGHILCWTIHSAVAEQKARTHADNITFEGYAPAPA